LYADLALPGVGGVDERLMHTGVEEGAPGGERRNEWEQGKGLKLMKLAGGRCMFMRRTHSFTVRMAG